MNKTIDINQVDNRALRIRKASGLTQAAFSAKYNIPKRSIENWEGGKSECPEYVLDLLERVVKEDFSECQQGAGHHSIAVLKDARPKWIPVSERLPEEETEVLICNAKGDIEKSQGSYSTETSDRYFIWYTSGWHFGDPIAWMPLPKPYKADIMSEF